MTTTERLMKFAREYRATHASVTAPGESPPTVAPEYPPGRVTVMPYERDLTKGAHVVSESLAMQRGRVPLTRREPRSN